MPRPGPPRTYVALRLGAAMLAWVDARAELLDLSRSEQMREMLLFAKENMPEPTADDLERAEGSRARSAALGRTEPWTP